MRQRDGSAYPGAGGGSGSNVPDWLDKAGRSAYLRDRSRRARVDATNRQRTEWLDDAAFKGKQMRIFPTNAKDAWSDVVATNSPRPSPTVSRSAADAIRRKAKVVSNKIGKP